MKTITPTQQADEAEFGEKPSEPPHPRIQHIKRGEGKFFVSGLAPVSALPFLMVQQIWSSAKFAPIAPPPVSQAGGKVSRKGWMRRHPFLTALLAYVLAALCFGHSEEGYTFNIGERIRQGGELRTGVDVNHPVGNCYYVYRSPGGGAEFYVQAPEVSYRPQISLVDIDDIDYALDDSKYVLARWMGIPYHAQTAVLDVQPTGRILCAHVGVVTRLRYDSQGVNAVDDSLVFQEQVHALPSPVTECFLKGEQGEAHADSIGTLAVTEKPGDWRRVAAAPFDYVVSPILNFTCTLIDSVVSYMVTR